MTTEDKHQWTVAENGNLIIVISDGEAAGTYRQLHLEIDANGLIFIGHIPGGACPVAIRAAEMPGLVAEISRRRKEAQVAGQARFPQSRLNHLSVIVGTMSERYKDKYQQVLTGETTFWFAPSLAYAHRGEAMLYKLDDLACDRINAAQAFAAVAIEFAIGALSPRSTKSEQDIYANNFWYYAEQAANFWPAEDTA